MLSKSAYVRPTRLDHFKDAKSMNEWLENHGLPVSKNGETNINTMLKATGAPVSR